MSSKRDEHVGPLICVWVWVAHLPSRILPGTLGWNPPRERNLLFRMTIPSDHATRILFSVPNHTGRRHLLGFHCLSTSSDHHPRWGQVLQFQVVKGKCTSIFLFLIMFLKFQLCRPLKQHFDRLDVCLVSGTEQPLTQIHSRFFTQMDTARCCGLDTYTVFLVICNVLCLIFSHDEPMKKR